MWFELCVQSDCEQDGTGNGGAAAPSAIVRGGRRTFGAATTVGPPVAIPGRRYTTRDAGGLRPPWQA